jgi:hypothetical protein
MRKLKKSWSCSSFEFAKLVIPFIHNTSTKRYARFLNSLASSIVPPGRGAYPGPGAITSWAGPNRAARRAVRFNPPAQQTPPERKITGAVLRGLERGRVA